MEKTIDNAKEYEGLFYFNEANVSEHHQTAICDYASISRDGEFLLWHYRIGNSNFQNLKHYFYLCFQIKQLNFSMKFGNLQNINVPLLPTLNTNHPNLLL